jgi:hypothetical protein
MNGDDDHKGPVMPSEMVKVHNAYWVKGGRDSPYVGPGEGPRKVRLAKAMAQMAWTIADGMLVSRDRRATDETSRGKLMSDLRTKNPKVGRPRVQAALCVRTLHVEMPTLTHGGALRGGALPTAAARARGRGHFIAPACAPMQHRDVQCVPVARASQAYTIVMGALIQKVITKLRNFRNHEVPKDEVKTENTKASAKGADTPTPAQAGTNNGKADDQTVNDAKSEAASAKSEMASAKIWADGACLKGATPELASASAGQAAGCARNAKAAAERVAKLLAGQDPATSTPIIEAAQQDAEAAQRQAKRAQDAATAAQAKANRAKEVAGAAEAARALKRQTALAAPATNSGDGV